MADGTMDKPETVQVDQVWRDADERSVGSGEFRVLSVGAGRAHVLRRDSGRTTRIRVSRLLEGPYEYIGKGR